MDTKHQSSMDALASTLIHNRTQNNWTIKELADLSGVSTATISRLENSEQKTPKTDTIRKLANALNIEPENLLTKSDLEYISKPKLKVGAVHTIWSSPLVLMLLESAKDLSLSVSTFGIREDDGSNDIHLQAATNIKSNIDVGPQLNCKPLETNNLRNTSEEKYPYLALDLEDQIEYKGLDCILSATDPAEELQSRLIDCATIMRSISGCDLIYLSSNKDNRKEEWLIGELKTSKELSIFYPEGTIGIQHFSWLTENKINRTKMDFGEQLQPFKISEWSKFLKQVDFDLKNNKNVVSLLWEPYTSWFINKYEDKNSLFMYSTNLLELSKGKLGGFPIIDQKLTVDRWAQHLKKDATIIPKFLDGLSHAIRKINRIKKSGNFNNESVIYLAEYFNISPKRCLQALNQCDFKITYYLSWVHAINHKP